MEQYIDVIYESSTARCGAATADWLTQEGIGRQTGPELRLQSGLVRHRFTALRAIAMNSAIIFVSDEATFNEDWKNCIDSLPKDTRIIPAGQTENVDYNDPKVIPPRIEEINFIPLDGNEYVSFLDSLITDPDFYTLKNFLIMKCAAYKAGHFDGNLLTSKKDIRNYRKVIKEKFPEKSDPSLIQQLTDILEYLDTSEKYAVMLMRKHVLRWVERGGLIAAAVILLVFFYRLASYYSRISSASLLLSVDSDAVDPSTGAIRMVEAISNPFSENTSKKIAYKRLIDFLDMPWAQTPVGMNYISELGGVAIPEGSQYVWTSTSSGTVLLWDSYTGEIVSKSELTDKRLYDISVYGDTLFVIDAEGQLYRGDGTSWSAIGIAPSVTPEKAVLESDGGRLLLFDADSVVLMDAAANMTVILPDLAGRTVLAAGFSDDGLVAACSEGGKLAVYLFSGRILHMEDAGTASDTKAQPFGSSDEDAQTIYAEDISVGPLSIADIRNGRLIITDTDGQVWMFANGEARRTALLLPKAIDLDFVTDDIVIYHERNRGTGLYDLLYEYDYGDVLGSFSAVMQIRASEELVLMESSYGWIPVALSDILPASSADAVNAAAFWNGRHAEADLSGTEGRGIKSVDIAKNGVLKLKMVLENADSLEEAGDAANSGDAIHKDNPVFEVDVILDPARIVRNDSGHLPEESQPEEYLYYDDEPFCLKGLPTTVGIRYVPANPLNENDYYFLLCGASDGSFAELGIDPNTGTVVRTFFHTIPSRSPITEIFQTENGYLLKDENGTFWRSGSGINTVTVKGITATVKSKLRSAVTDSLAEIISEEVWNDLDLKTHPGGDGKRWE